MKKYKRALLLAAIVLEAALIVQLKQYEPNWNRWPALTVLLVGELFGVQLLDVFLGILGLAFAGLTWGPAVRRAKHGLPWMARAGTGFRQVRRSGEEPRRTKSPSTKDCWR